MCELLRLAPEGRRGVAWGFNPRRRMCELLRLAPEGRRGVAWGFNPRGGCANCCGAAPEGRRNGVHEHGRRDAMTKRRTIGEAHTHEFILLRPFGARILVSVLVTWD